MTEIVRAGTGKIATPHSPAGLIPESPRNKEQHPERSLDSVQISGATPQIDQTRQHQRMAQEIAHRTLKGMQQAQKSLAQIADAWREGNGTPEALRGPASSTLEAAGLSYKGIQPLMNDQVMQIGPYKLQGFELVGGVIPMQALLPGDEAPAAINQGWERLQQALGQASEQLQNIDRSIVDSLPPGSPGGASYAAGAHNLPPRSRILELLS